MLLMRNSENETDIRSEIAARQMITDKANLMYDVVIIGSGPAGSNLARLIGDQYHVLLIDKRNLDDEREECRVGKCCGGLLAPDAQRMIAKLGLGFPKDILVHPQLFAVRAIDLTNNLERLYQRHYFNMDRERFDRWMISILPTSVKKAFNAVFRSYVEISGGYEVKYRMDGQEKSVTTRVIIGADGAGSNVRKALYGASRLPDQYISIQEWFKSPQNVPYFTAVFDESISDFYAWIIPKDHFLILGAALKPGADVWSKFDQLKVKLTASGFDFGQKIRTEGSLIFRPRKTSQFLTGQGGIALIGEAAGAISPSSAEGISYALKTSSLLAKSLQPGIDGFPARYRKYARVIQRNIFLKNLKSPAMYHPVVRKYVMRSGLKSIR